MEPAAGTALETIAVKTALTKTTLHRTHTHTQIYTNHQLTLLTHVLEGHISSQVAEPGYRFYPKLSETSEALTMNASLRLLVSKSQARGPNLFQVMSTESSGSGSRWGIESLERSRLIASD